MLRLPRRRSGVIVTRYTRELASGHYRLLLVCVAVMTLHLWEDAIVHEEGGADLASKAEGVASALAMFLVAAALYPLLWRWARPILVAFFGVIGLLGGVQQHVSDAIDGNAAGGDYTGFLFALAGLVLLGLAAKLAYDLVRARGGASA
jgi:asparagine N-glycosylation enzyme membrane subunit Stt3